MRHDVLIAAGFCTLVGVAVLAPFERPPGTISPQARNAGEQAHRLAAEMGSVPQFRHPYVGTVPMLGRDFALPDGQWTLALLQRCARKTSPPVLVAVFARHDGPLLTALFEIAGNRQAASPFDPLPISPACVATDIIWSYPREADAQGQDCTTISTVPSILWAGAHDRSTRLLARGLALQGIHVPIKLVIANIAEANAAIGVTEAIWLNPDAEGIAPDTELNPGRSAWAPARIGADPAKVAFVARLRAWMEGWRPVVRAAVMGSQRPAPADAARLL